MEAELRADEIEALRNDITTMYDEVRGLLVRLPLDDRAQLAGAGREARQVVVQLMLLPMRDARAARRLADGHAGLSWSPARLLDIIADWRLQRALSGATRRDLLAAWENSFNELFSSLNDVAEATLGGATRGNRRARAIARLHGAPDRVAERLEQAQRLIER